MALAMRHAVLRGRKDSALSSLTCPEDRNLLTPVESRGVEVDVCLACHGVWLDSGELERILNRKGIRKAAKPSLQLASCVPDIAAEGLFEIGGAAIEVVVEVVAGILTAG